jgi:type I restriction enzyme S subunit
MQAARYSAFKDSGVAWLGEIPAHWGVAALKRGFHCVLGKMLQPDPSGPQDTLCPYLRSANIQWSGIDASDIKNMWVTPAERQALSLRSGDLLVNEGGDVGRAALWANEVSDCYFQNSVHRVRAKNCNSTRFLRYWLLFLKEAGYLDAICNKATIAHLTGDKLAELPLLMLPLDEQLYVADFLDRETADIDALIHAQSQMTAALIDKKRRTIYDAVVRGIDQGVALKSSGALWFDAVPNHWAVDRMKWSTDIVKGGTWGEDPRQDEFDIPCVRVADFDRNRLVVDLEDPTIRNIPSNERTARMLMSGDLVLEKSGGGENNPVGCVVMYENTSPAVCSNFTARIQSAKTMCSSYWRYVHAAAYSVRFNVRSIKQTSGIQNLDIAAYFDELVPFPPPEEQVRIAAFLEAATSEIDNVLAKQAQLSFLLQEKRKALVSAVVTGKLLVSSQKALAA